MARKSVHIRDVWIVFGGTVLAAIISVIGVVFTSWPHSKDQAPKTSMANHEKAETLSPLELAYSIMGMHKTDHGWKEVPVWGSASLNSGDCFKVSFKTNEDCFLYVLLYGSGSVAQCLFPHEKIAFENFVKGDLLYTVPDGDKWYYLDEVPGVETIYILACCEPMSSVAGLLEKMEQADAQRQLTLSEDIQRDIIDIQTRALESSRHMIDQRGVSVIAPAPSWNLTHDGNVIKAITEVIHGTRTVVKIISFNHK